MLPLAIRIFLATFVPLMLVAGSLGWWQYEQSKNVLLEHEYVDLGDEARLFGRRVLDYVERCREDAFWLAHLLSDSERPAADLADLFNALQEKAQSDPRFRLYLPEYDAAVLISKGRITQIVGSPENETGLREALTKLVGDFEQSRVADEAIPSASTHVDFDFPNKRFYTLRRLGAADETLALVMSTEPIEAAAASPRTLCLLTDETGLIVSPKRDGHKIFDVVRQDDQSIEGFSEYFVSDQGQQRSNERTLSEGEKRELGDLGEPFRKPGITLAEPYAFKVLVVPVSKDSPLDALKKLVEQNRNEWRSQGVECSPSIKPGLTRFLARAETREELTPVLDSVKTLGLDGTILDCDQVVVHFVALYYDPNNDGRFLGMAVAGAREEFTEQVSRELWPAFFWGGLLLAGVVGLFAYVAHRIVRPLTELTHASHALAASDYEAAVPQHSLKRRDEIGALTRAFAAMSKQVRSREARLQSILDSAAEGIIITDRDGKIESANPTASAIFGCSLDSLDGSMVDSWFAEQTPQLLNLTDSDIGRQLEQGFPTAKRTTGRRANGEEFPMEVSISMARTDGETICVAIVRDVTEQQEQEQKIQKLNQDLDKTNRNLEATVQRRTKRLTRTVEELQRAKEAANAANNAKDVFLATVNHELRTPLNNILGFCDLLLRPQMEPTQKQTAFLTKLKRQGKHLEGLINDIFDYQKIILKELQLETKDFPLGQVVADAAESVTRKIEARNNALEVHCDEAIWVRADERRVRQCLINLLSNAAKFTQSGRISIEAKQIADDGQTWAEIRIKDTGRGIAASDQAKLFKPFAKILSKEENPDGTGLGLAITKSLCEHMGGRVHCESVLGEGSTFVVRIPALDEPSRAPKSSPKERQAPPGIRRAEGRKVLVIDDNPDARDITRNHLEDLGVEVLTAENGAVGLKLAAEQKPDVILLDAIMPEMDGWTVLTCLKEQPATRRIPVIMVTILDAEEKGFALGVSDFVTKPVDWDRLSTIVGRYIDQPAKVLVVDDDPDARELARNLLTEHGWEVAEAANGREGLELIAAQRPAFILLDLLMPVMDGFEFVEQIRQNSDWRNIPIIVVTTKVVTSDERDRLNSRVLQILEKGDGLRGRIEQLVAEQIKIQPEELQC